jgi:hypothetical protein
LNIQHAFFHYSLQLLFYFCFSQQLCFLFLPLLVLIPPRFPFPCYSL